MTVSPGWSSSPVRQGPRADSLADVLERVLDKGVVIAGDVVVNLLDIELLSLKLRLFIASADTAREMGMDWWTRDPFYNSKAADALAEDESRQRFELAAQVEEENRQLRQRLAALEERLGLPAGDARASSRADEPGSGERS